MITKPSRVSRPTLSIVASYAAQPAAPPVALSLSGVAGELQLLLAARRSARYADGNFGSLVVGSALEHEQACHVRWWKTRRTFGTQGVPPFVPTQRCWHAWACSPTCRRPNWSGWRR